MGSAPACSRARATRVSAASLRSSSSATPVAWSPSPSASRPAGGRGVRGEGPGAVLTLSPKGVGRASAGGPAPVRCHTCSVPTSAARPLTQQRGQHARLARQLLWRHQPEFPFEVQRLERTAAHFGNRVRCAHAAEVVHGASRRGCGGTAWRASALLRCTWRGGVRSGAACADAAERLRPHLACLPTGPCLLLVAQRSSHTVSPFATIPLPCTAGRLSRSPAHCAACARRRAQARGASCAVAGPLLYAQPVAPGRVRNARVCPSALLPSAGAGDSEDFKTRSRFSRCVDPLMLVSCWHERYCVRVRGLAACKPAAWPASGPRSAATDRSPPHCVRQGQPPARMQCCAQQWSV